MGCHFLLQKIFLTQGSNSRLLHWRADSLLQAHLGRLEQLSKCIIDNESQVSHWQRRKLQVRKGGGWTEPCGIGLESELSVWMYYTYMCVVHIIYITCVQTGRQTQDYGCVWLCGLMDSMFWSLRGPRSMTPVRISSPSAQIFISKWSQVFCRCGWFLVLGRETVRRP